MRQTGLNMEAVKKRNRSSILRFINSEGPISKKDIADRLSLTPAAVTQICGEFMESGLLVERGIEDEEVVRAGRKKVLIDIAPGYCYIFGINIDPEHTEVALCDLKGNALNEKTIATEGSLSPREFLGRIGGICAALREEAGIPSERIAGIGVGITGRVDKERGISEHAYGIWKEPVGLAELLAEQTGLPVRVENNVNAFAAAELLFGMGQQHDNLLLVKWGPGVGSSILVRNHVYDRNHGRAAELGHVIVEKDGAPCSCGRRGCLETRVAGQVLQRRFPGFPERIASEQEPLLMQEIDLFARTLVNAATILLPEKVILYGGLFRYSWLREALVAACSHYDQRFDGNYICYSRLSGREAYIGPVAFFIKEEIF